MSDTPHSTTLPDAPLPDELGERISAYLDGELSPAEAAEVQRLLADDPVARRFADELRSVGLACREAPAPVFTRDLSSSVVAEALRRQAAGEDQIELADRLEPEGYFGLPLGKSSRSWSWALVAAAAAVLIGFYGRPEAPTGRATVAQSVQAIQQAAPGVQVVNFQATPEMLHRLRQRLAMQSGQRAQLPGELMAVSQKGVVVEPMDPAASSQEKEQLLYVDAEEAELDRLLKELSQEEGESIKQVAPDTAEQVAVAPAPTQPGIRAVPLRVKVSKEQLAKLIQQQQQHQAAPAGQRRLVVLRIQLKPQAQP